MSINDQIGSFGPIHCLTRKGQFKLPTLQSPSSDGSGRAEGEFLGSRFPPGLGINETSRTIMQSSVVFVNEELELTDFIASYVGDSTDFTVIGGIGLCSAGKSTLMSMLAGNSPRDKYRQYIFRPSASRETIESGYFQTNGLHVYVAHESRVIYIDSKPFNSGGVFEDHVRKAKNESKSIYKDVQTEVACLGLDVDNVVFCIDWFVDVNAIHEVLRASVFSEFNFRKYASCPKNTNLVFAHQRAATDDYEMRVVKKRAQMLRSMFSNSRWNVVGGLSMARLGFTEYEDCESSDVNYVLMDELPQWNKDVLDELNPLALPYGYVLERLRPALLALSKPKFRTLDKMRPLRRNRNREQTAVHKKTTTKNENKDEVDGGDPDERTSFNPDFMPNITQQQEAARTRETWNEHLGLSTMSLPDNESALNSLNLLLETHKKTNDDDYIDSLLPVAQPRHTEREWFEYAKKVFDVTRKAYTTKYFLSNNGRLTPRIVRRLRASTKLLYSPTVKPQTQKEGRTRSKSAKRRISSERELVPPIDQLHLDDESREPSERDSRTGSNSADEDDAAAGSEDPTSEDSDFVLSDDSSDEEVGELRSSHSEVESSDTTDGELRTEKREPLQRRRRIASEDD